MPSKDVSAGIQFAVAFWLTLVALVIGIGVWLWSMSWLYLLPYGVVLWIVRELWCKHLSAGDVVACFCAFGTAFIALGLMLFTDWF